MNASLKSVSGKSRAASGHSHVIAHEGVLRMPGEMALYHGGKLAGAHIAWRIVGPANAPVVCALGGISANRRVCVTDEPRQSWWGQIAGASRALDSDSFRVLSFDYLGGSGDSTGPEEGVAFPSISSYDQAAVLVALLDEINIKSLRAIAGGSYGGMVALAF